MDTADLHLGVRLTQLVAAAAAVAASAAACAGGGGGKGAGLWPRGLETEPVGLGPESAAVRMLLVSKLTGGF